MMRTIIMATLAAALAGCATDKPAQVVYVTPEIARDDGPRECAMGDPPAPQLPDSDIDDIGAVRDREALLDHITEIKRRRRICRAWHKERAAPAPSRPSASS